MYNNQLKIDLLSTKVSLCYISFEFLLFDSDIDFMKSHKIESASSSMNMVTTSIHI